METKTGLMICLWAGAVASIVGTVRAGEPAIAGPASGNIVLNERSYWRHFFSFAPPTISPQRLKTDAEKFLGPRFVKRFAAARKKLEKEGKDPEQWCENVVVVGDSTGFSFDTLRIELTQRLRTAPPPADWMRPDFDDGDWASQKSLLGTNSQARLACYRSRFWVPGDVPKELRFQAVYRGGIRVFANGREIARQHLPAGDLAPEALAEEYPSEAYCVLDGECQEKMYHGTGYYAGYWQKAGEFVLAPEMPAVLEACEQLSEKSFKSLNLPGAYDPKEFEPYHNIGHGVNLNRKGWERLNAVRNRRLEAAIPASALVRGENVLAVEVRGTLLHPLALEWEKAYCRNAAWSHAGLRTVSLADAEAKIPSTLERPAGVQVWVEDICRRVYGPDYFPLPASARSAQIVAARNGAFAAQIAVGTDRDLAGLKVSVAGFSPDAGALAAKVWYPVAHRIRELRVGDEGRRLGNGFDYGIYENYVTRRYGSADAPYFDHLTAQPPAKIPANSAYPAWVSVSVPAGAAPGTYKTAITVEAEGLDAVSVPLVVEVIDWPIPSPRDFQTVMALEQSPYSLAEQYKAPLWSPEHWALVERSMAYLGQVHNSWWNVPVLARTEFGNADDSMVRITRRKDGSYAADFALLDRYLDLAAKHCGRPRVVNFIVMHAGNPGDDRMGLPPMEVPIADEATGQRQLLRVDNAMPPEPHRAFWQFLSTAIYEHMKSRGLEKAMYWGYTWDGPGADPGLYPLLAEFVPGVFWTKGSHAAPPSEFVKAVATAYSPSVSIGFASRKGWKNPMLWLTYPRYWGTVIDCTDYSPPFSFRMAPDRAIAAGSRGLGRMGADYWNRTYLSGMKAVTYAVGVPNLFVLWPGQSGPEPSIRFQVLKEGIQETEARIFLEQAAEKLASPDHDALRDRITTLLNDRTSETLIDSPAGTNPEHVDLCSIGWQRRSRRLYAAAAEVAAIIGLDMASIPLALDVPARGKAQTAVKLRNWTAKPRAWTLRGEQTWIHPAQAEGKLDAFQQAELAVTVDSAGMVGSAGFSPSPNVGSAGFSPSPRDKIRPEGRTPNMIRPEGRTPNAPRAANEMRGTLVLTDAETGRSESLDVAAKVGEVLALAGVDTVYNVPIGGKQTRFFRLINRSGADLAWKAEATLAPPAPAKPARTSPASASKGQPSAPGPSMAPPQPAKWLTTDPASGRLPPGGQCELAVTAQPAATEFSRQDVNLTVSESEGAAQTVRLAVFTQLPYRPPKALPEGTAISLEKLPADALKSHRDSRNNKQPPFWKPSQERPNEKLALGVDKKEFDAGLQALPAQETVYNVDGRNFTAFAAQVGPASSLSTPVQMAWAHCVQLEFQVWVDGQLRATSGLMGPTENPRGLVVDGLAGAREVRLVARVQDDSDRRAMIGFWAVPGFYQK